MDSVKINVNPGETYKVKDLISKADVDAFGIITRGLLFTADESATVGEDGVEFISKEEALSVLRHSASHLMAQAVKNLFPGTKLGIGPAIENGFYYDMLIPEGLTEADLTRIEEEMLRLSKESLPVERQVMTKEDAKKLFQSLNEPFKVELIEEIEGDYVTVYRQGEFVDLCRGPHVNKDAHG